MTEPKVAQKAPFAMDVDAGTYYWCSCGQSSKQPFCDGAHKGTDFRPIKMEIEEAKTVYFCGCKNSSNGGFCDGSHNSL
ncbi:MAG: CDGSH iron-sulfur domain-containing protein [Bacteroidota bacterium]